MAASDGSSREHGRVEHRGGRKVHTDVMLRPHGAPIGLGARSLYARKGMGLGQVSVALAGLSLGWLLFWVARLSLLGCSQ